MCVCIPMYLGREISAFLHEVKNIVSLKGHLRPGSYASDGYLSFSYIYYSDVMLNDPLYLSMVWSQHSRIQREWRSTNQSLEKPCRLNQIVIGAYMQSSSISCASLRPSRQLECAYRKSRPSKIPHLAEKWDLWGQSSTALAEQPCMP